MAGTKRKIRVYWIQFIIAAIWVGVIEVLIGSKLSTDVRRFVVDILVILTGILAFEPVGKHILKYLLICTGASLLIQVLRKIGNWYISAGPGFWQFGGPVIALAAITVLLYFIGVITQKDKVKF